MRTAGTPAHVIAKKLGRTEATIRQIVYLARKNGWFDGDDEPVDLEAELAVNVDRKVVRNINSALDGNMTNWQTHEMTVAAAKGRGIFKNHEVSKQDGASPLSVVAIQVVMPPLAAGDQMPAITDDQMGGMPAYVEGDVDEDMAARPQLEVGPAGTGSEPADPPAPADASMGTEPDGSEAAQSDEDRGGAGDTVAPSTDDY
jgi:hypothetical protein